MLEQDYLNVRDRRPAPRASFPARFHLRATRGTTLAVQSSD